MDWPHFNITLSSHSRSKQSWSRFNTRFPTEKCKNCRFLVRSIFSSLMHCNWAKFWTWVPQHKLLSMSSITITRISPTWSIGKPFVARVICNWIITAIILSSLCGIEYLKGCLPPGFHLFYSCRSKWELIPVLKLQSDHYTCFPPVLFDLMTNWSSNRFQYKKSHFPRTKILFQYCVLGRIWQISNVDLRKIVIF